MSVHVRNPHTVLAAIERRPKDVMRVEVSSKMKSELWDKVIGLARENGVPVQSSESASRGRGSPGSKGDRSQGGREGASFAALKEKPGVSAEELFDGASPESRGVWLALDGLQDPHNVGALFRAAGFFGIQGVLITQERSAPLSEAVYDVSSGGIETVPYAMVTNLRHALDVAKEKGLWILGTSERATQAISKVERDRPWLVVLGNEEKGMRRLTEESCDVICSIPSAGAVGSLNVSVAGGILMAHLSGALSDG